MSKDELLRLIDVVFLWTFDEWMEKEGQGNG